MTKKVEAKAKGSKGVAREPSLMERYPPGPTSELHADLQPYVEEIAGMGTILRHPLVFQVPFFSPKAANESYARKLELLDKQPIEDALFLFERPYRLRVLLDIAPGLPLKKLRAALQDVWTDTEFPHQVDQKRLLATFERAAFLTDAKEKPAWKTGERLPVYRGQQKGSPTGLSWSLSHARAAFFARRFAGEGDVPVVVHGTVLADDVYAYFVGRGEDEVVVDPKRVKVTKHEALPKKAGGS